MTDLEKIRKIHFNAIDREFLTRAIALNNQTPNTKTNFDTKLPMGLHIPNDDQPDINQQDNQQNLFLCRKISYGTNGNFVRYQPVKFEKGLEVVRVMVSSRFTPMLKKWLNINGG